MIGGERNSGASPAKNGAGVAAIGDDDLFRSDHRHDGGGSDGVALRSLKLASAFGTLKGSVPGLDLLVHFREASLHGVLPLNYSLAFQVLFDNLM